MSESQCSGCGAPIKWRYTPAGKRMPLDEATYPHIAPGTYVIEGMARCRPADPLFDQGRAVHMNHWATCPDRDLFRRSPAGGGKVKGGAS